MQINSFTPGFKISSGMRIVMVTMLFTSLHSGEYLVTSQSNICHDEIIEKSYE